MIVKNLELYNFRNYKNEKVEFSPYVNILVGDNAQGKTNMLEAIYFCTVGKSPKTAKERDLIRFEEDNSRIYINVQKKYSQKSIEILFNKKTKKTVKINGIGILKIADILGALNCVYFSPQELRLIQEAPEDRRKFMDMDISQLSKTYFYLILRYQKILEQRNSLLKEYKDIQTVKATLPVWDTQLAEVGAKIIITRIKFIEKLKVFAQQKMMQLTDQKESLVLEYAGITGDSQEEIFEKLKKSLQDSIEKDFKLGYTTIGPHRDDIKILVNGVDVRSFGSQGQQRTVALSLKLAELQIYFEETGEYPILLLDDVLSELDDARQNNLINICKSVQTIITSATMPTQDFGDCKIIKIKNGQVIRND